MLKILQSQGNQETKLKKNDKIERGEKLLKSSEKMKKMKGEGDSMNRTWMLRKIFSIIDINKPIDLKIVN